MANPAVNGIKYPEVLPEKWPRDFYDRPWEYLPGYDITTYNVPDNMYFFYNQITDSFVDECGQPVFDILTFVTPNELMLFKHKAKDLILLRKNSAPWDPEFVTVHLVYPENLYF